MLKVENIRMRRPVTVLKELAEISKTHKDDEFIVLAHDDASFLVNKAREVIQDQTQKAVDKWMESELARRNKPRFWHRFFKPRAWTSDMIRAEFQATWYRNRRFDGLRAIYERSRELSSSIDVIWTDSTPDGRPVTVGLYRQLITGHGLHFANLA